MKQASDQIPRGAAARRHWPRPRNLSRRPAMWNIGMDSHEPLYVLDILNQGGTRVKELRVTGAMANLLDTRRDVPQPFRIAFEASLGYGVLYDALQPIAQEVHVAHPAHLRA